MSNNNRIVLKFEEKAYENALKSAKQKYITADSLMKYLQDIILSDNLDPFEALSSPESYLVKTFYTTHKSQLPTFIAPDKAIFFSEFDEFQFKKLVTAYDDIVAPTPVLNGKLAILDVLMDDYNVYLADDKVSEYSDLLEYSNLINNLSKKYDYFNVIKASQACKNKVKARVIDKEMNFISEIDIEVFL